MYYNPGLQMLLLLTSYWPPQRPRSARGFYLQNPPLTEGRLLRQGPNLLTLFVHPAQMLSSPNQSLYARHTFFLSQAREAPRKNNLFAYSLAPLFAFLPAFEACSPAMQ